MFFLHNIINLYLYPCYTREGIICYTSWNPSTPSPFQDTWIEIKLVSAHRHFFYGACYTWYHFFVLCQSSFIYVPFIFILMIRYTSHYCNQLSHGPNLELEDINISFFWPLLLYGDFFFFIISLNLVFEVTCLVDS